MNDEHLADLFHFPRFWYIEIPAWWFRFLRRLLIYFDNQLAISVMIRFWLIPIWQDTTIIGRSISFIFRTIRVVLGILVLIFVLLGMIFWIGVWLLIPVLLLMYYPKALALLFLIWVIDTSTQIVRRERNPLRLLLNNAQGDINRLLKFLKEFKEVQTILWLIEQESLPQKPLSIGIDQLLELGQKEREKVKDTILRPEHLFLALLGLLKFHQKEARQAYYWVKKRRKWKKNPWIWQDDYPIRPIGGINRAWTGIITPTLDKVSTDLTQLAAKGKIPELIGRQEEIQEMIRTLGAKGRENVLLIGEAGSGKTTLVEGLANEIIRGTEFKSLEFKRLIALDIVGLTAGTTAKVKERLVTILDEIKTAGNLIIFIDEIQNVVASEEGQNKSAVLTALEPHLSSGEFQFIATTTPAEFARYIEPSGAFSRTFRQIKLKPTNAQEALPIIIWKAFSLEQSQGVRISFKAIESTIELARRYIQDRVLPDSAAELLEDTFNKAVKENKKSIKTRDIEQMVTEKTDIPVRAADSKQEKTLLLELEKLLHKRIVGQDEAVIEIADSLRRARVGMAEEGRLIASFLFAGATGVGKTETAKALAEVYFGSQKSMVRIDMSEYQTDESIYRLIGPPPGRTGYELGGQLTEAIRRRPFTVILLDEMEKANPRILDVFLQLIDDARLTDGSGRTVDFSNTMLIATSNVGTKLLVEGTQKGKPFDDLKKGVLDLIKEKFRPEFLNRFTRIIVYKPLTKEQVEEIAIILFKNVKAKLEKKEIKVEVSEELLNILVEKGYNPLWGARELRRVIRDEVEEKIAKKILKGEVEAGKKYTLTPEFLS